MSGTARPGSPGTRTAPTVRGPRGPFWESVSSLDHDGQDVAGREDEELLPRVLDLGAAVLGVDHLVADGDVERDPVAVVVDTAGSDRQDLALLGLLLGTVRDDETGSGRRLCLERLDDDPVLEGLDGDRHSGPPLRV